LKDTGESLGEEDERSVTDLLVEQVEFSDIILISKTDLVSSEQLKRLTVILKTLNTEAEIVPITNGEIALDKVLGTNRFSFERAEQAAGWLKEMRGEHIPETEEYGISSFAYTARRPFHPQKFYSFLHQPWPDGRLIRSKGYFWLATRPESVGQWNQAGGIARHGFAGMFWKAVPESSWPEDGVSRDAIIESWQEPFGDMRQELVFIGQGLDKESVIAELDACLLNDEELLAGKKIWQTFADPFPQWQN
jgi:G3E family GTPase